MSKKKKTTKVEKLLREMKTRAMTHKEIVQFLLRGTGRKYSDSTRRAYDSTLYDTPNRDGVLGRFCVQRGDGTWKVNKSTELVGPFTQAYEPYSYSSAVNAYSF